MAGTSKKWLIKSLQISVWSLLQRAKMILMGVLLCGVIANIADLVGRMVWLRQHGIGTLTVAIVLGVAIGNLMQRHVPDLARRAGSGLQFSKQTLLRLGIILYGLRLTVQDVATVGVDGVVIDAVMVVTTFFLTSWVGVRWLGLEKKLALLIGIGSSICGAAAILAAEPIVRARSEQVTVSVATVVMFGTVSIFLYPVLFQANAVLPMLPNGAHGFGIYIGSTIHEVAQVVATARSIGTDAADAAVIAKMVRVIMLAPFLIGLSVWLNRDTSDVKMVSSRTQKWRFSHMTIPWFAIGFIVLVCVNSVGVFSGSWRGRLLILDNMILAMAMAALGVSTHLRALATAGRRPLMLALVAFGWLVVGGAAINRWVPEAIAHVF